MRIVWDGHLMLAGVVQRSVTYSELKGKAVVVVDQGEKVGRIDEVLIDPAELRATAYLLTGDRGRARLVLDLVRAVGRDAVTVDRSDALRWGDGATKSDAERPLGEVLKMTVVDNTGTIVGDVNEVTFDPFGKIVQIEAVSGGLLGVGAKSTTIPSEAIRGVGSELITVEAVAD